MSRVYIAVLLASAILAGGNVAAQNEDAPDEPLYTYCQPWGAIPLTLSSERIGIKFEEGASEDEMVSVLVSESALDPLTELDVLELVLHCAICTESNKTAFGGIVL